MQYFTVTTHPVALFVETQEGTIHSKITGTVVHQCDVHLQCSFTVYVVKSGAGAMIANDFQPVPASSAHASVAIRELHEEAMQSAGRMALLAKVMTVSTRALQLLNAAFEQEDYQEAALLIALLPNVNARVRLQSGQLASLFEAILLLPAVQRLADPLAKANHDPRLLDANQLAAINCLKQLYRKTHLAWPGVMELSRSVRARVMPRTIAT